jgi:intein/homing endonuclease
MHGNGTGNQSIDSQRKTDSILKDFKSFVHSIGNPKISNQNSKRVIEAIEKLNEPAKISMESSIMIQSIDDFLENKNKKYHSGLDEYMLYNSLSNSIEYDLLESQQTMEQYREANAHVQVCLYKEKPTRIKNISLA